MPTPLTGRSLQPGERLNLSQPPVVGSAIMVGLQTFIVRLVQPYTRADGRLSTLIHWQTACASCKTVLVHFTTGLTGRFADVRRCPACVKKRRAKLYRFGLITRRRKT